MMRSWGRWRVVEQVLDALDQVHRVGQVLVARNGFAAFQDHRLTLLGADRDRIDSHQRLAARHGRQDRAAERGAWAPRRVPGRPRRLSGDAHLDRRDGDQDPGRGVSNTQNIFRAKPQRRQGMM